MKETSYIKCHFNHTLSCEPTDEELNAFPNIIYESEYNEEDGCFISGSLTYNSGIPLEDALHIIQFGDAECFTLKNFENTGFKDVPTADFWHEFRVKGDVDDFVLTGIPSSLIPHLSFSNLEQDGDYVSGIAKYDVIVTKNNGIIDCKHLQLGDVVKVIEQFCSNGERFSLCECVL